MSLPQYQIVVISCVSGSTVAIYDAQSFYSLKYSRRLNEIGAFVLVLPYSDDTYNAFDWDNFVEIYRTSPVTGTLILEETYLVRSKHHFVQNNSEQVVVGGLSLIHFLARRIINPVDDPASVDGYSTKSGAADDVMRAYSREQAADLASVARQIPELSIQSTSSVGQNVSFSYRYDNLLNILQEIALQSSVDFRIERTSYTATNMIIGLFGTDRTKATNEPLHFSWVGLSPLRGNLSEPSLKIDRTDEKNYVYTLGQGQGAQRLVVEATTDQSTITPFNRIEYMKDARNINKTDTVGLQTAATASLNEKTIKREFTFTPSGIDAGSIYRLDWDVADKVTVIWRTEEVSLRITGVEIEIGDSGEKLDVIVQEIPSA